MEKKLNRILFPIQAFFPTHFVKPIVRFIREFGTVVIGAGGTRLLTLLASIILARSLGVEAFGEFSVAYTVTTLVGQLPSVLDTSFVRHFSGANRLDEKQSLIRASLLIKLIVLALIIFGALIGSKYLAKLVFEKENLGNLLFLSLIAGGAFSLFFSWLAYFQSTSRFLIYAILNFLQNLIVLILISIYVLSVAPSSFGAMFIYTVNISIFSGVATIYLFSKSSLAVLDLIKSYGKTLLRFSSWLIPAGILYILLQRIDILMLTRYSDYQALGLYGAAIRFISIVSIFTGNLVIFFLPKADKAVKSSESLKKYLLQGFVAFLGIIIIIVGVVIWAPQIITLALGSEYVASALPLRLLLAGQCFIAITSTLSCLIYGFDRTDLIFWERVLEFSVAIICALLLVKQYEMVGAALSLVIANAAGCIFVVIVVIKLFGTLRPINLSKCSTDLNS